MHCGIFGVFKDMKTAEPIIIAIVGPFYLVVYELLICSVSGALTWPVCSSEADEMKQMLGRCQG